MMPTTELETNLRDFFDGYARAFHADLGRFCEHYHFPSTTARLDGTLQSFVTKDEAMDFFAGAKETYEAEGCTQWAHQAPHRPPARRGQRGRDDRLGDAAR